ncbi:MAG: hypothetical protein BWY68_00648 [bacterium ADurb.Bin400]|nr:MAG: hypothetical protein BWY68_00648 [bacterium ADurb.Bin400]
MESIAAEARPYIETLGLRWVITCEQVPDPLISDMMSDKKTQSHHLMIGARPGTLSRQISLVRLLCRASLAEQVDPALSTRIVVADRPSASPDEIKALGGEIDHLRNAWQVVEVWTGDVLALHWPQLLQQELYRIGEVCDEVQATGGWSQFAPPAGLPILARYVAQAARHRIPVPSLDTVLSGIAKHYPVYPGTINTYETIAELCCLYQQLPGISGNRTRDLTVLERSVNKVVRLLELPISPRLMVDADNAVWVL